MRVRAHVFAWTHQAKDDTVGCVRAKTTTNHHERFRGKKRSGKKKTFVHRQPNDPGNNQPTSQRVFFTRTVWVGMDDDDAAFVFFVGSTPTTTPTNDDNGDDNNNEQLPATTDAPMEGR